MPDPLLDPIVEAATRPRLADFCNRHLLMLTTLRSTTRLGASVEPGWLRGKIVEELGQSDGSGKITPGRIEQDILENGTPEQRLEFSRARYPLVALADWIALSTHWEGREEWEQSSMWTFYYGGPNVAGDVFYEKLSELKPGEDELAEVFFLCLCLGFKGKLADQAAIRHTRILELYNQLPDRIAEETANLTPQAYQHLETRNATYDPVQRWARNTVVLVALIFLVYQISSWGRDWVVDKLDGLARTIVTENQAVRVTELDKD